ncbi:hypothetical protein STEG23_026237, partial [Scotinomys teguina]
KRQKETEKVDGLNIILFKASGTLLYPCPRQRAEVSPVGQEVQPTGVNKLIKMIFLGHCLAY